MDERHAYAVPAAERAWHEAVFHRGGSRQFEKQRVEQGNTDLIEGERGASDLARRAYNNFWMDRGKHVTTTMRTSLVIDPPDGRVPPFTPEAQKKYDAFHAGAGAASLRWP